MTYMKYTKEVSVIVVNFNTKAYIKRCIESILKTDRSVSKEIIIVDNGSTDGSVEYLQKLNNTKTIKLIKNSTNTGFSFAVNQGIKISSGKHVLLLNSDTVVKENSIKSLIDFANNTSDAGVVGSRLLNKDGSIQKSCLNFPSITNAIYEYFFGIIGAFSKYHPKDSAPTPVDAVAGASFLISRKALEKVGLMDTRYYFYFEDLDYCRRVYAEGLKVYYLPSSIVYHFHGVSGKKFADSKNQWRRLIPSSKIYHGLIKHFILTFVLWSGQKWQKIFSKVNYR